MFQTREIRFPFLVLLIVAVLSSCGHTTASLTVTATPILSSQAYLTAAFDIMQQHSVNRKKVNWTKLRQEAFADARGAKTPAETYSAIQLTLGALGDHHSFFIDPQHAQQLGTALLTSDEQPHGQLLAPGIGYLELPGFVGSQRAAQGYVTLAQDLIRTVDRTGTCGWVVDLRNDDGGNMWPMLDGVGPILGNGIAGSFVEPDGSKQVWSYVNGRVQLAGSIILEAESPYHLKRILPPVAVLTGPQTASAGEAVVVAFRGRPTARSFGEPTNGLPTANEGFTLRDGAILWLTVGLDADRSGRTYESAIAPDQVVPLDASQIGRTFGTTHDAGVQAATIWLHKQEGC
jgi:carboxyl-terminal processing protease